VFVHQEIFSTRLTFRSTQRPRNNRVPHPSSSIHYSHPSFTVKDFIEDSSIVKTLIPRPRSFTQAIPTGPPPHTVFLGGFDLRSRPTTLCVIESDRFSSTSSDLSQRRGCGLHTYINHDLLARTRCLHGRPLPIARGPRRFTNPPGMLFIAHRINIQLNW
jgi:hypothetical protein